MNQVTTYRWSLEEDIRYYLEAGYQAIGVWRRKLDDYCETQRCLAECFPVERGGSLEKDLPPEWGEGETWSGVDLIGIDLLKESGLRVTSLHWAGGFTGSDGRSYSESVEDAVSAIRLANRLGAGCLVIHPGGRNRHTIGHARRLLIMALDTLLELAEPAGVTLVIEPMHAACATDWTFLTEMESAIQLIERFSSPYLKLVLDTYHFGQDLGVLDQLAHMAPYTGLVQLGDRRCRHTLDQERCPLGMGDVPLEKIVQGLLAGGYDGDFDVELSGPEIEMVDYTQLLIDSSDYFDRLLAPFCVNINETTG